MFFGGNLGLQFGTITNIQISPIVGLWVLPRVIVAAGPNFTYYQDPYDKTMIYGGKFYSEFYLIRDLSSVLPLGGRTGIFLHLEDEVLSLESAYWGNPSTDSEQIYNKHCAFRRRYQSADRKQGLHEFYGFMGIE